MRGFVDKARRARDDGLGLTEVIISMVIIMILMMALLSVIIQALRVSVANGTRASAAQFATERIEMARQAAVSGDCANIKTIIQAVTDVEDGRGTPMTVSGSVSNCTQTVGKEHEEPKLARVTVTVTTTAPGYSNPVVETSSDIYVKFQP